MTETRAFLGTLYEDLPEGAWLLIWTLPDKRSYWCSDLDQAEKTVLKIRELEGLTGVYFQICPSPRNFGDNRRCDAESVRAFPGVWGDFDIKGPAHKKTKLPPSREAIEDLLQVWGMPPTYLVDSGNGCQAFWLLPELMVLDTEEERAEAARLARRWNNSLKMLFQSRGWDVDATFDLARVFRMPGTMNRKVEGSHKPVRVLSFTNRRYTPAELEAKFIDDDTQSYAHKKSQKIYEGVQLADNLSIDPNATVDADLLDGLMEQDPKFAASMARNRKDLGNDSSAYDMSLATIAYQAGLDDQQVVNLLIYHRRKHKDEKTDSHGKLRVDYYLRTLERAKSGLKKQEAIERMEALLDGEDVDEEVAEEIRAAVQASSEEPPSEEEVRRQMLLRQASDALEIDIRRILKYVSSESVYVLETSAGLINLGGIAGLAKQDVLRMKILDATGHQIPRYKGALWDTVSRTLRQACEEIEVGEDATDDGQIRQWLDLYLECWRPRPASEQLAVDGDTPMHDDGSGITDHPGQIMIRLPHFIIWLKSRYGEIIPQKTLCTLLRMHGCKNDTVAVTLNGQKTSRSVWRLPRFVEDL